MIDDINSFILNTLTTLPGILIGFTFHEYAHAYMSTRFGDPTPERQGRLTVNPLAHIDLWGFLFIIFARFGWAKPVEINPMYYKGNVRQKEIMVSFAGPAANLIIAAVVTAMTLGVLKSGVLRTIDRSTAEIIFSILENAIWINCVLFIFNLIPIPPLDGFHILQNIAPPNSIFYTMERYSYIILMIFIISPVSNVIILRGAGFIYRYLILIFNLG